MPTTTVSTTTASTITPWHLRPDPLPLAFVGTPRYIEKLPIIEKLEGVSDPSVPGSSFGLSLFEAPVYFIFMMTRFGDIRIEVSEEIFNLLAVGDPVVISYRRGRWNGALKGKIAR